MQRRNSENGREGESRSVKEMLTEHSRNVPGECEESRQVNQ